MPPDMPHLGSVPLVTVPHVSANPSPDFLAGRLLGYGEGVADATRAALRMMGDRDRAEREARDAEADRRMLRDVAAFGTEGER